MKSFRTFGLLFLFLFLVLSFDLYAVSLSPEVVETLRKEGKLEEWVGRWKSVAERGMYEITPDTPIRSKGKSFGDVDTLRPLVVCVDFSDNEHTRRIGEFDTLLFTRGFIVPTGSFRDYYLEVSYGQHDPNGDVYGAWVRAPETYDYYTWGQSGLGSYPHNCQKLVQDILAAIDPYVNFQDYDYDGNGWIDGLIVIHAGPGAEQTGDDWDIWSHRWSIPTQARDGIYISSYTMQPEERIGGALVGIGVFCHEWGHFLGINWEEYDSDYSSEGLGRWTVMAGGSYNNNERTPAHHSAYCKYYLGWANVVQVQSNQTNVEILQAETSPVSYRLYTSGIGGNQFFMVENKQQTGFDTPLPGSGLLIYHVDVSKPGNDLEWCPGSPASNHFKTAIEQADGFFQLEGCYGHGLNEGDGGDPFPGMWDKRAFDDTTTLDSRNYYDNSTQVAVWNISDSDSAMYANLDVTWSRPGLYLDEFTLDDMLGGDGDGRPEGGETVKLYLTISNIWLPLNGTTVTASADTAGINFTDDHSYLGDIGTGGSANNYSDPVEFEVDTDFPGRPTIFTLHVEGNTAYGIYTLDFEVEVWAGNAQILIVDADSGSAADYQSYYTEALDSLREIYDIWDTEGKGDPDFSFNRYKYLIWYTGDHKTDLFTQAQVESLMSFLDTGGRLFLTSQDAAEVLSGSANPLFRELLADYLHCSFVDDNCTQSLVVGDSGDVVGDTLYMRTAGAGSPQNQTSKDVLLPDTLAITVLRYAQPWWVPVDSIAGIRYQGDYYKLVFFGFGFEGIDGSGSLLYGQYLSQPHFIMERVLNWLKSPLPTINLMSPNGGESWLIGSTYDIEWQSLSFEDSVKIEYSINGGADWLIIEDTTTNDGEYSWDIPDTPSDSCLVRISDVGNGVPSDTSDTFFSLIDYVPGDPNADGIVNSADVVYLINYLFVPGSPPPDPLAAGDPNGDCVINSADVVYLINYLFVPGSPPPVPGCAK